MKQLSKEEMSKVEGGGLYETGQAVANVIGVGNAALGGLLTAIFSPW